MHLFSDLRLFEKPPKKAGFASLRWIAWRFLMYGAAFLAFTAVFAAIHYVGGEPIYYKNEDRYLTSAEAKDGFLMFFSAGGLFFILGLAGVRFIPRP
ncbi:hypothetical protein [Sphingomonas arenae]|uniref:hypothetical protein n=1 Tax=Sphingomonas arenae TaxID=2812555 RepID=UPI0019672F44|nr:hypothetical protein [Sphingomonas arenae]